MSAPVTVTPLSSYRDGCAPYPFCPGCGHHAILDHLNAALVTLKLDPRQVVLVSDIGCSGLSDQYFATSAFHGLHGRSITYATGIKLARPDLKVIVIMGDGSTGIGGAHLLNAARRNIGLTVLVFNNFNFGMTGGQHSTTTPAGAVQHHAGREPGAPARPLRHGGRQRRRLCLARHELRPRPARPHGRGHPIRVFRAARHLGALYGLLRAGQAGQRERRWPARWSNWE